MVETKAAVATTEFLTISQHNKIALKFLKAQLLKSTDPAHDSISSSLFSTRRRSFWAAAAVVRVDTLYFILSFFLTLLFFIHFNVRISLLSRSFSFIHSFSSFPSIPVHLFLSHSVCAQYSLFISSTIVCFSLLFRSIPPTFYMTSIYKCKCTILH